MILKNYFLITCLFSITLFASEKDKSIESLIFIYNAESGILNAALDYIHKAISPETYDCNLCNLTYNNFGKIKEWEAFINSFPQKIEFRYRDHLKQLGLDIKIELPILVTDKKEIILEAKDINSFDTLDQLMNILSIRLGLDQN